MLYCGQTELSLPAVNCAPAGREVDVVLTVDEADEVEDGLGGVLSTLELVVTLEMLDISGTPLVLELMSVLDV